MKYVAIIKATGANYTSLISSLKRLGVEYRLTNKAEVIQKADWVILPGVGEAKYAMDKLIKLNLVEAIKNLKQPVLGICLGMQLLCTSSEESSTKCLNVIPLKVRALKTKLVCPHMGWNNFSSLNKNSLFKNIKKSDNFYYVHSYAADVSAKYTLATTNYGIEFSSIIQKDNFVGVQFHPEKSGSVGEQFLKNFFGIRKINIIPSIDLLNAQCVRLQQGDFTKVKQYSSNPINIAKLYQNAGAKFLHIVNLDAAQSGRIDNLYLLKKIRKVFKGIIQVGGGIRTIEDVDKLLAIGINRVVIGSLAIKEPQTVQTIIEKYGANKIVLALDLKQKDSTQYVAINGWKNITNFTFADIIKLYPQLINVLCTDISLDGMSKGCNQKLYVTLKSLYPQLQLQASGGISSYTDINKLEKANIDGAIIGKALYEKKIDLKEALKC